MGAGCNSDIMSLLFGLPGVPTRAGLVRGGNPDRVSGLRLARRGREYKEPKKPSGLFGNG